MWHEGQGKRGPNEIGSCLLKYLEETKHAANDDDDLEIVFYSDLCWSTEEQICLGRIFLRYS